MPTVRQTIPKAELARHTYEYPQQCTTVRLRASRLRRTLQCALKCPASPAYSRSGVRARRGRGGTRGARDALGDARRRCVHGDHCRARDTRVRDWRESSSCQSEMDAVEPDSAAIHTVRIVGASTRGCVGVTGRVVSAQYDAANGGGSITGCRTVSFMSDRLHTRLPGAMSQTRSLATAVNFILIHLVTLCSLSRSHVALLKITKGSRQDVANDLLHRAPVSSLFKNIERTSPKRTKYDRKSGTLAD